MRKKCQVCGAEIQGVPFNLSNLKANPGIMEVCEQCASSTELSLYHLYGLVLNVQRDLYIKCNKDRLERALDEAQAAVEEFGWEIEEITIRARSEMVLLEPDEE